MPAVGQVRLMDQGTAHSRRSSTELGALCQAWAELVRSSLVVLRRVYPVRQADWITNQHLSRARAAHCSVTRGPW